MNVVMSVPQKLWQLILFLVTLLLPLTGVGQSTPKYELCLSLDYITSNDMYTAFYMNLDRNERVSHTESHGFSATMVRSVPIWRFIHVQYGLSLSDKGPGENVRYIFFTGISHDLLSEAPPFHSQKKLYYWYAGVPLMVALRPVNTSRRFGAFAEAGWIPELLLHKSKSHRMSYDLNRLASSYILSAGLQLNLQNGYTLALAPEVRFAAAPYDKNDASKPSQIRNFNPLITSLTVRIRR